MKRKQNSVSLENEKKKRKTKKSTLVDSKNNSKDIEDIKSLFKNETYKGELWKPPEFINNGTNIPSNIVYSCTLNKKGIPLKLISSYNKYFSTYNTNEFPTCQFCTTIDGSKVNTMIFSTSKILIVGATSKPLGILALRNAFEFLGLNQIESLKKLKVDKFSNNNTVVTYDLGYRIDIEKFKKTHVNNIEVKDRFPGITFRPIDRKIQNISGTAIVFATGKINFVGIKNMKKFPILKNYIISQIKPFLIK